MFEEYIFSFSVQNNQIIYKNHYIKQYNATTLHCNCLHDQWRIVCDCVLTHMDMHASFTRAVYL